MSHAMILYGVLAIFLLAVWHFYAVLFALLGAVATLSDLVMKARNARAQATSAAMPLAGDIETFRIEATPSEIGTTRVVPKVVRPSIRLALTNRRHVSARKMMQRDG